jgi:hypothetical protein
VQPSTVLWSGQIMQIGLLNLTGKVKIVYTSKKWQSVKITKSSLGTSYQIKL